MVIYFRWRSAHNSVSMNVTITVLWILDTLQLIIVSHSLYYYLVLCHGDYSALSRPNWSIVAQLVPSACAIGVVQYVWIMRLWTLNRNKRRTIIAYCMLFSMLLDFVLSISWVVEAFRMQSFLDIRHHLWLLCLSIGLITFNDISATVYFCYLIRKYRDGLHTTDTLINKLIIYGVNTGLLTW
ncbi:hypothetical protein B0H21DRAFT_7389 [Amylocystis lapponica]|nr:hypothetical protein B0H21DRAFT_7389 [Amylocystis lapponica]